MVITSRGVRSPDISGHPNLHIQTANGVSGIPTPGIEQGWNMVKQKWQYVSTILQKSFNIYIIIFISFYCQHNDYYDLFLVFFGEKKVVYNIQRKLRCIALEGPVFHNIQRKVSRAANLKFSWCPNVKNLLFWSIGISMFRSHFFVFWDFRTAKLAMVASGRELWSRSRPAGKRSHQR